MTTKNKDQYTDWYALWMKQSREFFDSAQDNLQTIFKEGASTKPEDHMQEINDWLKNLKKQWTFTELSEQQKKYNEYWQMLTTMCTEASDLMLKEWIRRSHADNPIKNTRELYEVWLNSCQEIYKKNSQTKIYQEAYGEFLNAAFTYWGSIIPGRDK